MEFSSIGAEDSIEEARSRLESCDALVVWGAEIMIGIMTKEHLERKGSCGQVCELDILIDPDPAKAATWRPAYIIITEDGEPVILSRGP
jgi:hypothetical protein